MLALATILLTMSYKTLNFRTSACVNPNEEYSLCGWTCPPTCVNLRLLARGGSMCPLRWECRVGCRCKAGFIRDEYSKRCVLVQHCPATLAVAMRASAAPAGEITTPDKQAEPDQERGAPREKRSNYGTVYTPPCAASAPVPSYAPAAYPTHQPHGYGYSSHAYPSYQPHPVLPSYGYGYSAPHYRADDNMDDGSEIMNFSDLDHMAMARAYGYEAPAPAHYSLGGLGQVHSAGPSAIGLFPNANVRGCNVPLLLSCSPSVVPGRLVDLPAHYGGGAAVVPATPGVGDHVYRGVDEHPLQSAEETSHHEEQMHPHDQHLSSIHDTGHMSSVKSQ